MQFSGRAIERTPTLSDSPIFAFFPSERRKPIREALERARERVDYAIGRLKSFEEVRCLRWRCIDCGYVKKFTRLMPAEVAPPCAKCGGDQFQAFG